MNKTQIAKQIGKIPSDWKMESLNEISWFQEGPGLRKWQFREEGIKVINITNMVDGVLDLSKTQRYISWEEFNSSYKHFECEAEDIVIASSGNSYCKHAIVRKQDLPLVMNTSVIRFQTINDSNYEFLNQFLKSSLFKNQIDFMITGGAQPNFGPVHLNLVKVPLPPLPEQQKIAEILSTVDEKIEAIDQRIAETQHLKKGLMQQLLTKGIGHTKFKDSPFGEIPDSWEIKKVNEISKVIDSLHSTPSFSDIGYPMVRVGDINKPRLTLSHCLKVNEKVFNDFNRNHKPKKGDILMTRVGSFGKTLMVDTDKDFCIGQNTVVITDAVEPIYLYYTFKSTIIQKQFNLLTNGSSQPSLSLKDIRNLNISFPAYTEQQKIAEILSSVDEKLQIQQDKKTEYQELKKGLMQQLLTGKIRVKVNPN